MSDKFGSSKCLICRGTDGMHKFGCPDRPGYGNRIILSTNLPEKTDD